MTFSTEARFTLADRSLRSEVTRRPLEDCRVLLISKTLREIPRFANRVSCLHGQHSSDASYSRVQLRRRSSRTWRLLGDPTLPSLSRASICQLRETILQDISVLYANGLSYTPDLTRLEIVSKRSKVRLPETIYRPLIDVSDFDLDAVGQTILSTEPGKQTIRHVEAQFDVLAVTPKTYRCQTSFLYSSY